MFDSDSTNSFPQSFSPFTNSGLHLQPTDELSLKSLNQQLSSPPHILGEVSQAVIDTKSLVLSGNNSLMPLCASPLGQESDSLKTNKSSVDELTGEVLSNSNHQIVQQSLQSAYGYLKGLTKNPKLTSLMNKAFGNSGNAEVADSLVQAFGQSDFSGLPAIEILPLAKINGANGAFASETNTIYLSQEFIAQNSGNSEAITSVLLEEIGHYIDSKINVTDAAGDEGEIFAATLQGKQLSEGELLALKVEDDTATITLDGKAIQIEMDNTLGSARNIGTLSGTQTFSDFVGTTDTDDFYRFSLSSNSNFSLTLNGLSGDADVQLIQDVNNNGIVDSGDVLQSSTNGGTTADTINRTLNAGTYFARVYPMTGVNTNYSLSLSAVPIVQTVNIGTNQTLSGTLSTTDPSNPTRSGTYRDDYALTGVIVGQPVKVNLNSSFDNYLQIINAATGQVVAENDDANGTNNAEVTFTPVSGVNYLLRATSFSGGATGSYTISTSSVAPATVSITATDANAAETVTGQTTDPGQFTITRSGSTASALTVNYSVGGNGTNGSDYNSLTGSVVIAAGATSAVLPINIIDDNLIEGSETAVVTLLSSNAYTVGAANSATVTIADNDSTVVNIGTNQTLSGTLSTTDPSNPTRSGTYRDDYALTGVIVGQPVKVNLNSSFDNYLQIINAATGQVVAENDDANGTNNAEVTFTPVSGVNYLLRATSFSGGATGSYTISTSSVAPATVSITATDANAAETVTGQTTDPGQFTITRSGSTASALTVNYSVGGNGTNGSDYNSLTGSVVIAAGATSAVLPINIIDDNLIEGSETAVVTLLSSNAYTVGAANSATVTIADNDSTVVNIGTNQTLSGTLSTTDPSNPTRSGTYRDDYALTGVIVGQPVKVNLNSSFDNYLQIINAATGQVVAENDDANGTNNAEVTFTPVSGVNYLLRATSFSGGATGSYTISTSSVAPATVSITATDANAAETVTGQTTDPGQFTITRSGSTASALTVNYSVGGNGTNGSDYNSLTGSVVIAAGATSAVLPINIIDDNLIEGSETAVVTLLSSNAYTVGAANSATVTIADNDSTVVNIGTNQTLSGTLSTTDPSNPTRSGTYRDDYALTGVIVGQPVKVNLNSSFDNYLQIINAATGQVVAENDDANGTNNAEVTFTPVSGVNYLLRATSFSGGATGSYTISTSSVAPATVSITATDANAAETVTGQTTDPGQFTITRSGSTASALTVNYSVGGNGTNGSDYNSLTGSVVIAAGATSAVLPINIIDDNLIEGSETAVVTLLSSNAYTVGAANSATVTIADNDSTVVNIGTNQTLSGTLSTTDPSNPTRSGTYRDDYALTGVIVGQPVKVNLNSSFDNYLQIINAATGQVVAENDDANGTNNAEVTFTPVSGVNYLLRATSFSGGATGSYTISTSSVAPATVSITATDANAAETVTGQTTDPGQFTITRSGSTASALTVNYSVGGNGTNGSDYNSLTGSVVIAAGATSAVLPINIIDDNLIEGSETAVVTLLSSNAYTVGAANSATVTIADNDSTVVNIGTNQTLSGTLSTTDPSNPTRSGTYRDDYALTGVIVGQPVKVNLNSSFDNYLQIINAATGQVVAENDDANGTNNAEVTFTPVSGVNYLLRATSFSGGATGSYTISTSSVAPATVSITATDANAAETVTGQTTDPGQFTITRSGSTASALTVNYSVGGNGTNGSDYNSLTGSVVIAAGATSAVLPINIIDDNLIEGSETAVVTLLSSNAYTVGAANSATVTIADNDSTVVNIGTNQTLSGTLSTTDPSNPTRSGTYRDDYALTGVIVGQPVKVNLNSSFDNYLQIINAATGQVVAENDDANGTNNAEVTFTPVSGVNYLLRATSFSGGATGSYTISTSSVAPATVSITATDANAAETVTGQTTDPGQFTITRSGSTASALTVNYSVGGNGTNGSDYNSLTGSVVIAAGATSAVLPINIIDDNLIEGSETAVVTLLSSNAYTVGAANSATVTIADNDSTVVNIGTNQTLSGTLSTTDPSNPTRSGTYRDDYALTGVIVGQPVKVNLNSSFDNYLQIINAATGQVVAENDDANGTNNAEVTFTPVSGVNYLLRATSFSGGATGSYTISTSSVAPATVSITATDANAAETVTGQTTDPGQFTITRSGSTASALTVNYSVGGNGTNGSDYNSLTGSVVIAAGATSAVLPINIIDDNLIEGSETAVVTLLSSNAYTVGAANSATVTIADNDTATVNDPIASTGTASSNSLINTLWNPNFAYWNTSSNGGTISYSFLSSAGAASYYGSEIVSPVSEGIKSNVRSILSSLESLINVHFVEVADTATNYGVIRYMFSNSLDYAYAYYPISNTDKRAGDVHLNPNFESDSLNRFSGSPGNHGYMTLIHETFHALGLKHPGNYNGSGTGEGPFLSPAQDNTTNTLMSYNFSGSAAITPMAYDIQALQYIYGAKSNNAANTTYSFSTVHGYTVGGAFKGSTSQIKQSLWDSGGIDTLDFSSLAASTGYYFDINQGGILTTQAAYNGLSYTDRSTGGTYTTSSFGTTLAYNTVIENLVNSRGNDRIIANSAANQFLGYTFGTFTGNDVFESTSSSDVLQLSGYSLSNLTPTVSGTNLSIGLGWNGSLSIENYYGSSGSMKFLVAGNYYTYNAYTGWTLTSAPAMNSLAPDQATTGLNSTVASPYNSPLPLRPVDCKCAICSASGKSMHTLGNSNLSEVIRIS